MFKTCTRITYAPYLFISVLGDPMGKAGQLVRGSKAGEGERFAGSTLRHHQKSKLINILEVCSRNIV